MSRWISYKIYYLDYRKTEHKSINPSGWRHHRGCQEALWEGSLRREQLRKLFGWTQLGILQSGSFHRSSELVVLVVCSSLIKWNLQESIFYSNRWDLHGENRCAWLYAVSQQMINNVCAPCIPIWYLYINIHMMIEDIIHDTIPENDWYQWFMVLRGEISLTLSKFQISNHGSNMLSKWFAPRSENVSTFNSEVEMPNWLQREQTSAVQV